ncbi:OprD family porin [Pseudomonas sp. FP1154]|uniref:OprD family porin n=1 Tax=unclassified Pseudomonas TaxID=196821 RepID=UPI001564E99B|nr:MULTISPECIES: OprD family porin [unclassified Pseudomonas]QKJ35617.1 OprD family porin [Pseudomonas sp. MPDS]WLG21179.1 OprD family porin [Pseudomonas sp. FP1154]
MNRNLAFFTALALFCHGSYAQADFLKDSSATLTTRNFYLNRDFRQSGAPQAKAEEWTQGFFAELQSGYTEGTVGFGLDALGELGIKLDSGRGRRGTALLPYGPDSNQPVDEYSELGLTAKMRLSQTRLKVGTLMPIHPLAYYSDTRLLPSTFTGAYLTSSEVENLTVTAARLTEANGRDSSSNDDISYAGQSSDHLDLLGGDYTLGKNLTLRYHQGELQDIYRQHFSGVIHVLPLGEGMSLRSDLRYVDSSDTGAAKAGKIDNRNFNGMFTLTVGAQRFAAAFQHLSGDSVFPVIDTGTPYVANLVTYNSFTKANEKSWQLRYEYDFAALGIPGLTFMTRYVKGSDIRTRTVNDGSEWERDTDLTYVFQSGALEGLNLRWRNVTYRSGDGLTQQLDENRLIVGYTWKLW